MTGDGNHSGLEDRLLIILRKVLQDDGLPVDGLEATTHLFDDAGVDSLLLVTFLLQVEAELEIVIEFEALDFTDLVTVRRFADVLAATAAGPVDARS